MPRHLYFLGVLPSKDISREVLAFKKYAAQHFRTSRALHSPAHITLFPPFFWEDKRLEDLNKALQAFAAGEAPFELHLNGFDCFRPRVIFIRIVPNPALNDLQARLLKALESSVQLVNDDKRPYHPHLTVAFKDLYKKVFPEAWAHFSAIPFERQFPVKDIALLRHQDGYWEVAERYFFRGLGIGD